MQTALTYYKSFLQEKQSAFGSLMNWYDAKETPTETDAETVNDQGIQPKNETKEAFPETTSVSERVFACDQSERQVESSTDSDELVVEEESASSESHPVTYQVSFWVEQSYAYTRPTSFEYFGETYEVNNWTQAYVQVVTLLFDDYPKELEGLLGKNISTGRRVDLARQAQINIMTAPKQIAPDMYIETNLSASDIVDKMKRLLEICLIDYDNLCITYQTIDHSEAIAATPQPHKAASDEKTVRSEFIGWMMDSGLKPATIFAYLSALNQSSKYGVEHGLISIDFLKMSDPNNIHAAYSALMGDDEFSRWNQDQHNRFRAAILKYYEYRSSTGSADAIESIPDTALRSDVPILSAELKDRFAIILRDYFENGFRPGNAIDINRFKLFYSEKYGSEISESDERIGKMLMAVGASRNGRIYAKADSEQRDVLAEIRADVDAAFAFGASCVYLEAIFERYQDQLTESLQIFNSETLRDAFLASCGGAYYSRYSYLASYKKTPDTENDVIAYMKASHVPVSYDTLKKDLWFIPFDKIKHILATTKAMVNVAQEAYFYAPNLPISAEELKAIIELIHGELLQTSFISGADLIELIQRHCPSVVINTDGFPAWGLRNALGYLLRDHFAFNGNIISSLRKELSLSQVFRGFCAGKDSVTLDELKNLAIDANTRVYWESVYSVMVRISQDEFVNKNSVSFDTVAIDSALDMLISGDYAPTKSVNLFFQLPSADYPWNGYLLESYVYSFSRKYRLVHPCFQQTDYCGAIVRKESGIFEYYDLVVKVLADSNAWRDKKDALSLLTDEGYQQRNAYKEIDAAVSEARMQKEQRLKQRG